MIYFWSFLSNWIEFINKLKYYNTTKMLHAYRIIYQYIKKCCINNFFSSHLVWHVSFYYKEYYFAEEVFESSGCRWRAKFKTSTVTPSAFSIRAVHASRRHEDIHWCWFLPCLRQKEETCHVADAWLCIPGRIRFPCKNSERNGQAKITCQVTMFQ